MTYHNVVALIKRLEQSHNDLLAIRWPGSAPPLLQPGSPTEGHDFRSTKGSAFGRQVVHILVNIVRFITEPIGQLWLHNFFAAQVNDRILKPDEVTTNRTITKLKKHLAACRWGFNLCLR